MARDYELCPNRLVYQRYNNLLHYYKNTFQCPHRCGKVFNFSNYESHCSDDHHLDAKRCCVWCKGRIAWPKQEKYIHGNHLLACWKTFFETVVSLPSPRALAVVSPPALLQRLPPRAHDVLCPVSLAAPPMLYRDQTLLSAVSAVLLFLNPQRDTLPFRWFHVAVDERNYALFAQHLEEARGLYQTLPHACWCALEETRHRHLIVATPFDLCFLRHFVAFLDLRTARIETALDLVNVLGDLSDQRCRIDRCPLSDRKTKAYAASVSLPENYRLPLLMLWDGGVMEDEGVRSLSDDLKRIQYVCRKARHFIAKPFVMCSKPTPYALHLFQGAKIYFRCEEEFKSRPDRGDAICLDKKQPHHHALLKPHDHESTGNVPDRR